MTVRSLIKSAQREIGAGELLPQRAAELLGQLTALMGNVNDEIRDADMEYATVLLRHLEGEEAANRAKIRAETTPEYQRKREARDAKELVVELIRSLKYVLKAQTEEMRLGGR
jgi:hypothetical protein